MKSKIECLILLAETIYFSSIEIRSFKRFGTTFKFFSFDSVLARYIGLQSIKLEKNQDVFCCWRPRQNFQSKDYNLPSKHIE